MRTIISLDIQEATECIAVIAIPIDSGLKIKIAAQMTKPTVKAKEPVIQTDDELFCGGPVMSESHPKVNETMESKAKMLVKARKQAVDFGPPRSE